MFGFKTRNPNLKTLGLTYEDALRIAKAKSPWMVQYLRARRQNDPLKDYFRKNHLLGK